ncbi:hypothetical protein [Paeniglutamicibacter terrestris]|uniref:Uncharacterized protein n=1 Tax=Paeniglutamicibacter terrestris TaxID=2723403 RepID=A0ABX1G7L4_9MICC|nr:hypothetical protein [Paeniglutamicibacter terrestris]NKG22242.1 hypothetical protein [Paeniglutamicibacter terrestris]
MNRRTALKASVWSVPVIALAVAAPAAAASTVAPTPISCTPVEGQGARHWVGVYSDGQTVTMKHSDAMSSVFGSLCRAAGSNPGAGK